MDQEIDLEDHSSEIKTKSIEQTLLPLVKQISTLLSHRERSICSERSIRVVARVGQAVNVAIERFVTVGESIADDNPEIKSDLYQACKDARVAGEAIESLCEKTLDDSITERGAIARAARCLLSSVTRVLILADVVVVKQLIFSKDKVSRSLCRLENVTNFTEFVKAFSQFGGEMVELAHVTGERGGDLKDERRRAQMSAARQVLERSTMLLLTSSKTCLRHPDSETARQNRDTVFCQMRQAMDLIHHVVRDGVDPPAPCCLGEDEGESLGPVLRTLDSLVEMTRLTTETERLGQCLDTMVDRTQDFTDSAYTPHHRRENILSLCHRIRNHLQDLIRVASNPDHGDSYSPSSDVEQAITQCLQATRDLRLELIDTAGEQTGELALVTRTGHELVTDIRSSALAADVTRLEEYSDKFTETVDHILEICKLLRHMAGTESLQVATYHAEYHLKIYAPQLVTAARTLADHPSSKIAKENLEVFADMFQALVSDITALCKEIMDKERLPDKHTYMSLPRPGKHGTTNKPLKAVRLNLEEQEKIAKAGLEMKLATNEMEAETEKWQKDQSEGGGGGGGSGGGGGDLEENNDIVKRAKNMSGMAFSMYQFTRGEGTLRTTQDLFTQAEYFAEEANRLYKVVRQFSYQVPIGSHKKELLEQLDKVPTHVQQLQFTVKNPTVGKAATFTKVDSVIHETKNLMSVISKVVTTCFVCATKYVLLMPRQVLCTKPLPQLNGGISSSSSSGGFPSFLPPPLVSYPSLFPFYSSPLPPHSHLYNGIAFTPPFNKFNSLPR
uniref:Alpha-catulin n=4 Tax=Cacopsylla melanoneura TaxID=428564 RepID=A0A8D8LXZ5_9HEMI